MRVFFSVGLETDPDADELTYVAEEAVRADFSQCRAWIERYEHGHELGKLTISVDDGHQTEIKDELYHLLSHVCLRAVPDLVGGQKYSYHYMDFPSYVHFQPHGGHIEISGDHAAAAAAPRDQLLQQLVACGLRYMDYLRLLGADRYRGYLQYLQTYADAANAALKTMRRSI